VGSQLFQIRDDKWIEAQGLISGDGAAPKLSVYERVDSASDCPLLAAAAAIQSTTVEAGRAVFKGEIDAAHELVVRIERHGKPLEWRSSGRGDVFEVVVEASDKIPLGEGRTGNGFIVTSKVGTTAPGSGADVTNVHLAGDLEGALIIRPESDVVTKDGAVTFADVALEGGEKLPVTFLLMPKTK
jgi:hypothetical protein